MSGRNLKDDIAMAETSVTVILALCLTLVAGPLAHAQDVAERYNKSCAVCHAAGAAGAPRTGVPGEWAPRLEKGMDALISSVEKGLKAMPPKGMCFDCSSEDYRALIVLMSTAK
jgi:cytochrome c5